MSELEELRRRVQRLEDLEAIRRLKARYLNACDSQDPEGAKQCFASGEVVIDMGHVGVFRDREAFAEIYRNFGCQPFILDMHHGANPEIEFRDPSTPRASGRSSTATSTRRRRPSPSSASSTTMST